MPGIDWLTATDDIITSAAIVVTGVWVVWKFKFYEKLRRHREIPALDGTLTAETVPLTSDTSALTLHVTWRNRGVLPIDLCPEHSMVEAYEFTGDARVGLLRLTEGLAFTRVSVVAVSWDAYVMEPHTDSAMTEHFVVSNRSVYAFRWTICQGPEKHYLSSRELIRRVPDEDEGQMENQFSS